MDRKTNLQSLALPPIGQSEQPRYLQLYHHLREAIRAGQLHPGQRMPSSRMLAHDMGLARGTVMLAYEQMSLEGYFVSKKGAGTYIADILPEAMHPDKAQRSTKNLISNQHRPLSNRLEKYFHGPARQTMKSSSFRPFQPGLAPLDVLPRTKLARLANSIYRSIPQSHLGFGDGAGYYPLREALASYLATTRGLACTADQLIITNGSQQAFHLACQVLLDENDAIWMEDPGYGGARVAFSHAGQEVIPIPLDDEGLCVSVGQSTAPHARMVYVTPAHQYPAGMTMSLGRRLDLIRWVAENNAWILEDDYDGEFRYKGRPLATLHSLDPNQRVIYAGSLSKVLAPAFRLGYLVVPEDMVAPFTFAKAALDRHAPTVQQAIMAKFIEEGHFGRHLRRIRTLCKERQEALLDAASRYLKHEIALSPDPAGLHLVGRLKNRTDDMTISNAADSIDLTLPAISSYSTKHPYTPSLIFGYSSFVPHELTLGAKKLAGILAQK